MHLVQTAEALLAGLQDADPEVRVAVVTALDTLADPTRAVGTDLCDWSARGPDQSHAFQNASLALRYSCLVSR